MYYRHSYQPKPICFLGEIQLKSFLELFIATSQKPSKIAY